MKGSPGYLDVDASSYVARDVPPGVVNTCDTGHYPLDIVGEPKNTDSKTSPKKIAESTVGKGHKAGNTDVMTRVECLKSKVYTFPT